VHSNITVYLKLSKIFFKMKYMFVHNIVIHVSIFYFIYIYVHVHETMDFYYELKSFMF